MAARHQAPPLRVRHQHTPVLEKLAHAKGVYEQVYRTAGPKRNITGCTDPSRKQELLLGASLLIHTIRMVPERDKRKDIRPTNKRNLTNQPSNPPAPPPGPERLRYTPLTLQPSYRHALRRSRCTTLPLRHPRRKVGKPATSPASDGRFQGRHISPGATAASATCPTSPHAHPGKA